MFVSKTAPQTTRDAARTWASAYTKYAIAGGVPATPKEQPFASALESAFNPNLAGAGPALFIQALQTFWLGLAVPAQAGTVTAVIPVGSVSSPQPPSATPQQQANALAQVISAFTIGSVKVTVPPGAVVPLL